MMLGMMGTVLFTRLTAHADYVGHVLPGLIVTGLGLGLIFAPATASATAAIKPSDAGAASAMVNTTQQIGGSVGTSLLNTIAVSATMGALRHSRFPPTQRGRREFGQDRGDPARLHHGLLVVRRLLWRGRRSPRSSCSSRACPT
jgi:hypothetical protein